MTQTLDEFVAKWSLHHTTTRVEPATLTHDIRRHYGCWAAGGSCRLRIFERGEDVPVILCSQLTVNGRLSISEAAEYLAAATVARYLPRRFDEAEPAIWLEHKPADPHRQRRGGGTPDIAQVRFASWRPVIGALAGRRHVRIGAPSWQALSIAEVEALLGPQPGLFAAAAPNPCLERRRETSSRFSRPSTRRPLDAAQNDATSGSEFMS
ncbi:MAG: hypothetical protein QM692_13235 [Thermomicrobiales bacterium]